MIRRSEVFFQRFLDFLVVLLTLIPETIHLFIDLLSVILTDKFIQFPHLFFCLEVEKKTEEIHLCLI